MASADQLLVVFGHRRFSGGAGIIGRPPFAVIVAGLQVSIRLEGPE